MCSRRPPRATWPWRSTATGIGRDIDFELARRALDAGCLFALDSDAHSIGELRFSQYAIAHARLARIPAKRVINCWDPDRLEEWMMARSAFL